MPVSATVRRHRTPGLHEVHIFANTVFQIEYFHEPVLAEVESWPVEGTPGHMKRSEWQEKIRRQMIEEGTIEQHGSVSV